MADDTEVSFVEPCTVTAHRPEVLIWGEWRLVSFFDAVTLTPRGRPEGGRIAVDSILRRAIDGEVDAFNLCADGPKYIPTSRWREWDRAGELPAIVESVGIVEGGEILFDAEALGVAIKSADLVRLVPTVRGVTHVAVARNRASPAAKAANSGAASWRYQLGELMQTYVSRPAVETEACRRAGDAAGEAAICRAMVEMAGEDAVRLRLESVKATRRRLRRT